jgi:hypothetical protein
MPESVYDASIIGYANVSLGDPTGERRQFLEDLIAAIHRVLSGRDRLRVNTTLRTEYEQVARGVRNDVVDQFFAILTGEGAVAAKNSLRSFENDRAHKCNWPSHDRHLIAAAIDGVGVTIHVTENRLGRCANKVWQVFKIRIEHIRPVLPEVTDGSKLRRSVP